MRSFGRLASAVWALVGIGAVFSVAVVRLGSRGIETVRAGLGTAEWIALIALVLLFLVGEGWGALQRKWVPRVVRRASDLRREAAMHHRVFAPLYGMHLIGGDGRSRLRAWAGTVSIIVAVLVVRSLPEPWRGIVDLAVASALVWGLGAIMLEGRKVFE